MSRGSRAAHSADVPSRIGGPVDWYRDAIIYELHVRAYADSNGDGIGDFTGLAHRLDYLADLGVTAIWLLPFYPSPLRDDGYDIGDYRTVHPDYGDLRQFKRFLAAAHARGIRVITELVVNHTSDQHPWFQRARHAAPGTVERDYYVWSDHPDRYADARIIFQDFEASNWTWDPVAESYFWHRFYAHQPDLNYDNPVVEAAVIDVLDFWLDMGVDGLRLDAVPYLYEREGTNCENLPETHDVLKRLRKHMDARYPDRMLLAEANQWPEDAAAYFGDGDECHMNFNFPVMPRLFMSLRLEHRTPIVDIMEQTPDPPPGGQWATFLRNHDELTLEMVTDEERDLMLRAYATDAEMRINLGIRRRLAPLLGGDRRKIELLNALLFSLPGTPVIYYGDEIGMGDNVYLGDRNGVRTPMQWSADRNGGFSTANPHRLYLPLITEQGYHYESVNVETQAANPASLLSWMRQLIALRKRHGVLGRGTIEFLEPDNPHVLAFVRHPTDDMEPGERPLLCVANLSRLAQQVELDLRDYAGTVPVEVFGQNRFSSVGDWPYSLTLTPYGFLWFSLEASHAADPTGGIVIPAVPHLPGSWAEVLRRRAPLGRVLARWLPSRRWFAGKDKIVREVSIDDIIELDDDVALAVVRTSFTEGDDHQYAVPLLRTSDERATEIDQRHPGAIVALLDDGAMVDAMAVQDGAGIVAASALRRRTRKGRRSEATGHPRRPGLTRLADDPRDVHVLGVEQSNSSVIVGGRVIAKLIRRLSPGENPDVTLPMHLRAAGFDHVPGVAGTLDISIDRAAPANVVVVHDAVSNEADLWQWSQDQLGREVERIVSEPAGDGDTVMPAVTRLLAQRTAEMHLALAGGGPGFEPERFSLLWQRSIQQSLRAAVRETQRAVRRNRSTITGSAEPLATMLLDDGDQLLAAFDVLRARKLDAARIRVHGDFHLGQALWTGRDVIFIDFEGEPGRSVGERSIKRSPLADVGGILRSLDYAGRVVLATSAERGRTGGADATHLEQWRRRWTESMQHIVWTTYADTLRAGTSAAGPGHELIPGDSDDARLLLDAHVLLKALYEVRYELANRPAWVAWPLAAVAQMLFERR
ncbi:MAG: maltose alpha-D-glucosyltransferase [Ilumatobacteraceae bacterium]